MMQNLLNNLGTFLLPAALFWVQEIRREHFIRAQIVGANSFHTMQAKIRNEGATSTALPHVGSTDTLDVVTERQQ